MKYEKIYRNNKENSFLSNENLGVFVQILLLILLLVSCTVLPKVVKPASISWDGNVQNSGFVMFMTNYSGLITSNAVFRYNSLIEKYGREFNPPLSINDGIYSTNWNGTNLFVINPQALTHFVQMNHWKKQGR